MTKEEFIENANLNDTYTAFVYDNQISYQYLESKIDVFGEDYLEGTANYSIEAYDRDSDVGEVICENFSNIDQIETDKLIVGHYTADNGTEVYVLLPNAAIFTAVVDDCECCTETICQPTTYDMCAELIRARRHNKFDEYSGGVAFISSIIPEIADEMGQDYYLVLLN